MKARSLTDVDERVVGDAHVHVAQAVHVELSRDEVRARDAHLLV